MNFSLYIAKRYLFSKKSHNAINIISMVAICGVTVATIAMVCTLSVLNGFRGLMADMFSSFDPELKITIIKGKVFNPINAKFLEIKSFQEIEFITECIEDNVLIRYRERQIPAVLKGVSNNFDRLIPIKDIILDGSFQLQDTPNTFANLGIGVANVLGVNSSVVYPMEIYAPKRNTKAINLSNPIASFNRDYAYISSLFMINQPIYDDNYLIVPLTSARKLFEYTSEVSAWELKLKNGANLSKVQKKIQQTLGNEYAVKNRYEQQEAAFKMINIEKWFVFLMLCFILLIAASNIVGSLSILIVDKQKDIITLRNLGVSNSIISRIFLLEGWMTSIVGAIIGIISGILICFGQQHFGWIKLGNSGTFTVTTYPVQIAIIDLSLTLATVLIIGFLSVIYPVQYLSRKLI